MPYRETLNAMALTRVSHFNLAVMHQLYNALGSATAIVDNKDCLRDVCPECPQRIADSLRRIDDALIRAQAELEYNISHGIETLHIGDSRYPQRLKECDDAPLVLFYKGNADLNTARIINIVGTRKCTPYGQDVTERFVSRLRELCPRVLIVSGLAYGIDIIAHRAALRNSMDTVGVLAHGLDTLYPSRHSETARQMLEHGGLLTEFFTNSNADKVNFVRRNRIVAGMSDATVLIESAAHGGGLITARLAMDYNRSVFAVPGRTVDTYSEGCNNLIRDNVAALMNSADDFVQAMGWQDDALLHAAQSQGIERTLFPELSPDEQRVVDALRKENNQQINMLAVTSGIAINRLTAVLFTLEMNGIIRSQAGGIYHLID